MPKKTSHPHVAWRDGRPRFAPGPELRAAGHKGADLKHPDGRWFSRGEAVDWSDAFVKSLAQAQPGKAPRPQAAAATAARASSRAPSGGQRAAASDTAARTYLTVEGLFDLWYRSPKFQLPQDEAALQRAVAGKLVYAPATIRHWKSKARIIEQTDLEVWTAPADALTTPVVFGLYETILQARGISAARGAVAALSVALAWGKRRGRVSFRLNDGQNPAHDLDMATPPPRIRVGTKAEIEALVATADALGRPDVGDMIMLGVWTGQRQGDRLALVDRGLHRGRRVFVQAKTGVKVAIREVPQLAARLAAAAERRRGARATALMEAGADAAARAAVETRFARIVLNELVDDRYGSCFWRPFTGPTYTHLFAEVRDVAVRGIRVGEALPVPTGSGASRQKDRMERTGQGEPPAGAPWLVAPCPSLADFHDQDLRDTAVTWLALGGSSLPQICAVTGHSLQSATRILKHYLAMSPELADSAIGLMLAWFEGDEEVSL
jgi:hypothetical protein